LVVLNPQRLSLLQLALVPLDRTNHRKISQVNNSNNRHYSAVALALDCSAVAVNNSSNKILSSLRATHVRH
jgi:hypothetical protein